MSRKEGRLRLSTSGHSIDMDVFFRAPLNTLELCNFTLGTGTPVTKIYMFQSQLSKANGYPISDLSGVKESPSTY